MDYQLIINLVLFGFILYQGRRITKLQQHTVLVSKALLKIIKFLENSNEN